jgi:small conductance mechanosensitive channel
MRVVAPRCDNAHDHEGWAGRIAGISAFAGATNLRGMLAPLVATQTFLYTSPLLHAATATPDPAGSAGSATATPVPTPAASATTISGALNGALDKLQVQSTIACTKDDVSVCGIVLKMTGNKTLGQILEVILGTPLSLLLIIALAVVIRRFLVKLIDRLSNRIANGAAATGRNSGLATVSPGSSAEPAAVPEVSPLLITRRTARARTLAQVLRSVTTVLVVIVATLMIMQELGLPIAPLLASASVVGVALGLGAQSLVRDVVAGMFMIVEDQYGVGDSVDVGAASGSVEAVGLRVTRLRDVNGTVWYVRNGEIMRVGNQSQGWSRAVLDVNVGYGEDVDRVEQLLLRIAQELRTEAKYGVYFLEDPEVWGLEAMTPDSVVIRLVVKTYPQQQTPVARELRRRIMQRFEAEGIVMHTMPRTVIVNEDEEPPEPVTTSRADEADSLEH